jgi:hypothetical protein
VISIIPKNINIPIYQKFQYRVIGIYKKTIIIGISIYRNSLIVICNSESYLDGTGYNTYGNQYPEVGY